LSKQSGEGCGHSQTMNTNYSQEVTLITLKKHKIWVQVNIFWQPCRRYNSWYSK